LDEAKQNLKGSPSRDTFKFMHKKLSRRLYGCDLDYICVDKYPYRIVCFYDYKSQYEAITFSEVIAFNVLKDLVPVFIVRSRNPETGPFVIFKYEGGDPSPEPPTYSLTLLRQCETWVDFQQWEEQIRLESKIISQALNGKT